MIVLALFVATTSPASGQSNDPSFNKRPTPAGCTYSGTNEAAAFNVDQSNWAVLVINGGECSAIGWINWFYGTALNRSPDRNGLLYWMNEAQTLGIPEAGWHILGSQEFFNRNPTNHLRVSALYWAALRRAPDAGGWAYWEGLLNNGAITWSNLAWYFLHSAEFTNKMNATIYTSYHNGILDKARPKTNTVYHEAYSLVNTYFEYWWSQKAQTRTWLDQGYWGLPATPGFNQDSKRYDFLNWADNGCSFGADGITSGNGSLIYTQARYCAYHDFYYRNFGDNNGINLDNSSTVRLTADVRLKNLSDGSCDRRYGSGSAYRVLCKAESASVYFALRQYGGPAF